jgi:hypothetical protein
MKTSIAAKLWQRPQPTETKFVDCYVSRPAPLIIKKTSDLWSNPKVLVDSEINPYDKDLLHFKLNYVLEETKYQEEIAVYSEVSREEAEAVQKVVQDEIAKIERKAEEQQQAKIASQMAAFGAAQLQKMQEQLVVKSTQAQPFFDYYGTTHGYLPKHTAVATAPKIEPPVEPKPAFEVPEEPKRWMKKDG